MDTPRTAERCRTKMVDPCAELIDDPGTDPHARLISGSEIGMERILVGMIAFGLGVGVAFPYLVASSVVWEPGQEAVFRLACIAAGLLVAGFAYGVARFTLYRTNQRLAAMAVVDPLTGLSNQRQFVHLLRAELCRADRQGHPVTLVIADLDHFKQVNDTKGHLAGNAVLALVGRTLREQVRPYDSACRIGGEEFAIILPQADDQVAMEVAERLRRSVEALEPTGLPRVTISLGFATFPADARTSSRLITRADDAMYRAKEAGRNTTRRWVALPQDPDDGADGRDGPEDPEPPASETLSRTASLTA